MVLSPDRPSKRSKPTDEVVVLSSKKVSAPQPRLFAPFRALGYISNHVPISVQTRGSKSATKGPSISIVSCLGDAWAMWEGEKMGLVFVGPSTPKPITSLVLNQDSVFAASGSSIIRYVRGRAVDVYEAPSETTTLVQILVFGEQLLALGEEGDEVFIWNIASKELSSTIPLPPNFTATHILHPPTYLNKILLASRQGSLALYNIRSRSLIHTFAALPGGAASPVTAITSSPAVDIVGVGYLDGSVRVLDLRMDQEILKVRMDGGIGALAFRMDNEPILATASLSGALALWDLDQRGRLLHLLPNAHDGAIASLEWIPGQPLLITSGGDNTIKQYHFETPSSQPTLLKSRSGHQAPPNLIRYYGEDGKSILTAGRDRALRLTSVVRDSRSAELSQGSLTKKSSSLSLPLSSLKLPPIKALSWSSARTKDWDDVLTVHAPSTSAGIGAAGADTARSWSGKDKKLGKWALGAGNGGGRVEAVCVSACGNFGLVGGSEGKVTMWNMQSGLERKSFVVPTAEAGSSRIGGRGVTGIVTDPLNRIVVVGTMDGTLTFFDFHTTVALQSLALPSSITSITLHRDNGLLAVVCDDLVVRIVDIETKRVVREMTGFQGRVLDVAFSPDSRWLITASLDSIIRTFDIPSGCLVDAFRTTSIPTSITFSPTGDFLASSHVDSVGVYLWANKSQFSEVALRAIEEDEIFDAGMPSVQGMEEDEALKGIELVGEAEYRDIYTTPDQLSEELLTLSLLPRSKWQTLLNLETIKARNKPKEPAKAPEKAPFFLPSLNSEAQGKRLGLGEEDPSQVGGDGDAKASSHRFTEFGAVMETEFSRKLSSENIDGDFESFFTYLKSLSPSATDLELRSSLITLDHLNLFILALTQRLKSHKDFEAVETFMACFLRIHGEVLVQNGADLREPLETMRKEQVREGGRLGELCGFSQGVLSFVRNAPM
ncbi:WD-repeat protein [Mrakia frigida]|uniref:WD-repeat protein n=1 Tax=Mrakia frigida TaxID=29902 RepID=UPI003FCC1B9A